MKDLSQCAWMCGYSNQLTSATGITMVMLKRRIFMSKQPTDVQYAFSVIETSISVDDTVSLHIGSWLVGAGGCLVGEWESYSQAVLSTKLGLAFHPLAMLDSNIHTFKKLCIPNVHVCVNNIIIKYAQSFYINWHIKAVNELNEYQIYSCVSLLQRLFLDFHSHCCDFLVVMLVQWSGMWILRCCLVSQSP